jgi:hypothetical protein
MTDALTDTAIPDLAEAVLAKTDLGREEIKSRTLRLPPLPRRLLLLADGQRDMRALAELLAGQDVFAVARELVAMGCLVVHSRSTAPPASAPVAPAAASGAAAPTSVSGDIVASRQTAAALAGLPPGSSRTREQVELARNFMINTINRMLDQYSHSTLVEQIAASVGADGLREHFAAWESAIASSWVGKKRLPELRQRLFEVL